MSKVIIYRQENGKVAIVSPVCDCGLTIEQIANKDVPPGCEYKIIDSSEIPEDGTYYDAWVYGDTLKINIEEAHEIKRNELRRLREPILKKLDVEFMLAMERGKPTWEIGVKKQALRDVTRTPLPGWVEGDSIDIFSKRLCEFCPECLKH